MQTIWKYPLVVTDFQQLQLPLSATIIHVGLDPLGALCLWAEVDSDAPLETVGIVIVGTGHPFVGANAQHLGSVIQYGFVWHIFRQYP